jgi:hypothetical protein
MRFEIRASSDDKCESCGATALLSVPNGSTREELAIDASVFLAELLEEAEEKMMLLWREEQNAVKLSIDQHTEELRNLLGSHAHFYTPFRNKLHRKLLKEALRIMDELREQTSRAS